MQTDLVKDEIQSRESMRNGLKAVHFLSTLAGGVIAKLMYDHREFSDEDYRDWITEAQQARAQIIHRNNNNEDFDDESLTVPNFGYTILDVKSKYKDDLIILRKVWRISDSRALRSSRIQSI